MNVFRHVVQIKAVNILNLLFYFILKQFLFGIFFWGMDFLVELRLPTLTCDYDCFNLLLLEAILIFVGLEVT